MGESITEVVYMCAYITIDYTRDRGGFAYELDEHFHSSACAQHCGIHLCSASKRGRVTGIGRARLLHAAHLRKFYH